MITIPGRITNQNLLQNKQDLLVPNSEEHSQEHSEERSIILWKVVVENMSSNSFKSSKYNPDTRTLQPTNLEFIPSSLTSTSAVTIDEENKKSEKNHKIEKSENNVKIDKNEKIYRNGKIEVM